MDGIFDLYISFRVDGLHPIVSIVFFLVGLKTLLNKIWKRKYSRMNPFTIIQGKVPGYLKQIVEKSEHPETFTSVILFSSFLLRFPLRRRGDVTG